MQTILLIDDDADFRVMCRYALEESGYAVLEAPNGEIGVQAFRETPAEIVICDIFMPEKDGFETIVELTKEFIGVKIVMVTGGEMGTLDLDRAVRQLGAARILRKPFTIDSLLACVESLIGEEGADSPAL